jgi:hypothetical protein
MKKLSAALLGAVILSTAISSVATPAFALGGCGRNFHRDVFGFCVPGGQNEDFCLATKGRKATRMPDGTYRCI